MKYFYFLLSLILFTPYLSSAQSNYKPGYVVTLNGDTVKGYIDYREWGKTPETIIFKNNLNSPAESFTPKNAMAFAVTGLEYFRRFTVRISQDQVTLANIRQGVDTSYIISDVFLHAFITGSKVSLFSYTDNIKTRYYILDAQESQPRELVYRVFYNAENSGYVQTQNRYRDQLEYLAKKYNTINKTLDNEISTAEYSEDEMIKIVRMINGNININKQFTSQSRSGNRWYAGTGITDNSLGFTGAIVYPAKESFFPMLAAGIDFFPNKNTQRLSVRVGLTLSENQHSYATSLQPDGSVSSLSNVIQRTISLSPQIIYNIYNSNRFAFFIDGGISINFAGYNNYYFTENFSDAGGIAPTVSPQLPDLRDFWFSVPVKTGITLNQKIEIYAGYSITTITGNTVPYTGSLSTYQLGINYLFGVK
jgi:hypothetical protein